MFVILQLALLRIVSIVIEAFASKINTKSMDFLDVQAPRKVNGGQSEHSNCETSKISDSYHSVRSSDGPISLSSSLDISCSPKSIDGAITKTLIIQGIGSAKNSISIKTVTELPKTDGKNKNCSGKTESSSEKGSNIGAAAMQNIFNRNTQLLDSDNEKKVKLSSNLSANELCVEKPMREMKRLIDFIGQTIKSNKTSNSNVPNQVHKSREKIKELKQQMDSIKAKGHCKNGKGNPAHQSGSNRKISNRSQITSKSSWRVPDEKKSIKVPEAIDEVNLSLNLSSGCSSTRNLCKCNPLRNSNRCIPHDAIPHDQKASICFCYCAYTTRGTDGTTYHTLCQCCEPVTNY